MKISLSGPSYTLQSVVAAAQQTMNWYPETIASPEEPRRQVLFGRPGLKFFAQLTPIKIRCLWAGGGRLFAIHADTESEIHEDASIHLWAGGLAQGGGNPDPAQIFSNGHQLLIISGGLVYCDKHHGKCNTGSHYVRRGLRDGEGEEARAGRPVHQAGPSAARAK